MRELILRINHIGFSDVVEHLDEVLASFPLSHRKVVEHIITAIVCVSARDIIVEVADEGKHFYHQREDILWCEVAVYEQIISGAASHWAPIDDFFAPDRMVAQECRC